MLIISPAQCRAARALLNWSQPVLAEECNLHVQTISNFEKNSKIPSKRTLEIIYATYLKNNIVFYENDGVQRRTNNVITYQGYKATIDFLWDVYETAKTTNTDICVSNVDESVFSAHLTPADDLDYMSKMAAIQKKKKFSFKVLVKEGDYNFDAIYAEYRWVPKEYFSSIPFYVYGTKLAFLFFDEETTIHVIDHAK